MRNFRGGRVEKYIIYFFGGGVENFRGVNIISWLNIFGRGDIFSGGVSNFLGGRVKIFRVVLGIIREVGLTFFREGLRFFWEGLRFFLERLRFFQKG